MGPGAERSWEKEEEVMGPAGDLRFLALPRALVGFRASFV